MQPQKVDYIDEYNLILQSATPEQAAKTTTSTTVKTTVTSTTTTTTLATTPQPETTTINIAAHAINLTTAEHVTGETTTEVTTEGNYLESILNKIRHDIDSENR